MLSSLWSFTVFLQLLNAITLAVTAISYKSLICHWGSNKFISSMDSSRACNTCLSWDYTHSNHPLLPPILLLLFAQEYTVSPEVTCVFRNFVQELTVSLGPTVFSFAMQFSQSKTSEDLCSSASGWTSALPLHLSSTFPKSPMQAFN